MHLNFVTFHEATGEIYELSSIPDYLYKLQSNDLDNTEFNITQFNTHYVDISDVDNYIIKEKTGNPATMSDSVILNLHNSSIVDCGELGSYEVTDGEFEFTIDAPGTYDIIVKSAPFFDKEFEVIIS